MAGGGQGRARKVERNPFQALPNFTNYRADKTRVRLKDLPKPRNHGVGLENKESAPSPRKLAAWATHWEKSHTPQLKVGHLGDLQNLTRVLIPGLAEEKVLILSSKCLKPLRN